MEIENATKRRIREQALKLICANGFENVTLSDICEASGVNKHTFYYYFKAKADLLKQYYQIPHQLDALDLASIFTNDSYVEQLWLLRKNILDFSAGAGTVIIKQLLIKNLLDDIGTFVISEEGRHLRQLQKNILEKGQSGGEVLCQTEADLLLLLLDQSVYSTIFSWAVKNGSFNLYDATRYMFERILMVVPERRKMLTYEFHEIL